MSFKTTSFFWLFWRILSFFVSFMGLIIIPVWGNRFPYVDETLKSSMLPQWFWQFGNFDGVHYIGIAKEGYVRQFTQAFFPIYPLLIKNLSFLFLGNFLLTGIAISSLSTFFVMLMFSKLLSAGKDENSGVGQNNIKWTIIFFLFFPMSFFLGSVYNESFFLFLVFACFYFAKKQNWILAGLIGALASATRLVGVFLFPAILWEYFFGINEKISEDNNYQIQINRGKISSAKKRQTRQIHKLINSLPIFLIPFGLISYMLYLWINFHDPLYFLHAQSFFGAERSSGIVFPLITLWRYIKILSTVPATQYNFWVAFWEAGFFIFGGIILIIITKLKLDIAKNTKYKAKPNLSLANGIQTSYLIFSWLCFLLPLLTGTLSSFPRYLLVCFPIYILLGNIAKKNVKLLLLTLLLILNFVFSILFLRGYWVS